MELKVYIFISWKLNWIRFKCYVEGSFICFKNLKYFSLTLLFYAYYLLYTFTVCVHAVCVKVAITFQTSFIENNIFQSLLPNRTTEKSEEEKLQLVHMCKGWWLENDFIYIFKLLHSTAIMRSWAEAARGVTAFHS